MARRSKLTKKVTETICAAITIGSTYEIAAAWAKITPRIFYYWMERGRNESERLEKLAMQDPNATPEIDPDERKYFQFFHTIYEANAEAAIGWLNVINNAAAVDPMQARYLLEKRFPKDYGQVKGATITYNVDVSKLSDEQLQRIARGESPDVVFSSPPELAQDTEEDSDDETQVNS